MPTLGTMGQAPQGRLWLRWVVMGVAVVCLAVAFVNLGRWQLDRLQQRRDNNGVVVAHEKSAVVDWQTVFGRPIEDADQWQRVRVTGTFDADRSLVVRYRSNGEQTGWEIVTPLRTPQGNVLVSRGFAERPAAEDFPRTAPPPPPGEVTVVGYVRRNEQGDRADPRGDRRPGAGEPAGADRGQPLLLRAAVVRLRGHRGRRPGGADPLRSARSAQGSRHGVRDGSLICRVHRVRPERCPVGRRRRITRRDVAQRAKAGGRGTRVLAWIWD